MTKKTVADELVEAISSKKKVKKQPKAQVIKAWIIKEVWNGRPIKWLGIFLSYLAVAYTSYELAKYYVGVPEFNGIIAFVSTLVIGSRTFKK